MKLKDYLIGIYELAYRLLIPDNKIFRNQVITYMLSGILRAFEMKHFKLFSHLKFSIRSFKGFKWNLTVKKLLIHLTHGKEKEKSVLTLF